VGFFLRVTTRQRNHSHDFGMLDKTVVEVGLVWQRKLEHDLATNRQLIQPCQDRSFEKFFSPGFFRAANINFRLEDGHKTSGADLIRPFELLAHDTLDAGWIGLLDERTLLGTEDALRPGLV